MKFPCALACVLASLAGAGFGQDSSQNKKDDPAQIGNRDVGRGVNLYSLEKEMALGKQLARDVHTSLIKIADEEDELAQATKSHEPRLIDANETSTVLHEGVQVRIGTRGKRTVTGKTTRVTTDGVAVQVNNQETQVPLKDIDWFRVTLSQGSRRTWLPLILCATIGTTSFVAAGATEERKSTYLPIAAALTVGLGLGGYYAGRALDRHEITYKLKEVGLPPGGAVW